MVLLSYLNKIELSNQIKATLGVDSWPMDVLFNHTSGLKTLAKHCGLSQVYWDSITIHNRGY